MKELLEIIIERLGIVKDQFLVFAIMASLLIFYFASDLAASENDEVSRDGIRMLYLAIGLLFFAATFYVYALICLPATEQEAVFEGEGKRTVAEHRQRKQSAQKRRENETGRRLAQKRPADA